MTHFIKSIDCFSHQGFRSQNVLNHYNEDRFFVGTNLFAVIDGATAILNEDMDGLNPSAYTSNFLANFYAEHQNAPYSAGDYLRHANAAFCKDMQENWPNIYAQGKSGPCASVACLKFSSDYKKATVANLGDCAIALYRKGNWSLESPHSAYHRAIDAEFADMVFAEMQKGETMVSARKLPHIAEHLRQMRAMTNIKYGVFNAEPEGLSFLQEKELDLIDVTHIALMSDGFIHPAEKSEDAGILRSAEGLKTFGCAGYYAKLKQIFDQDPDAQKYRRLKHMDDSTALLLTL